MSFNNVKNTSRASLINFILTLGTVIIAVLFCISLIIKASLIISLIITVIAIIGLCFEAGSTAERE